VKGSMLRIARKAIPTNPNWDALSPEGVWRVQRLAYPLLCGYSHTEIGEALGESAAWVSSNLAELRDELRQVGQQ
jgi:hypothetical protein